MKFERQFTKKGNDAFAGIEFKTTTSEIKNPDGTVVFSAPDIEVPANYSQVAADIFAQKYLKEDPTLSEVEAYVMAYNEWIK